jgi:curved DNA-binding protein CbpA
VSSPFEVLDVDRDADPREIHRAYRRRVKETHPDQGGSASEFQRVREAYEELSSGRRELRAGDVDEESDAAEESHDVEGTPVEYLDYEVVAERGWSIDDPELFEKAEAAGLTEEHRGRLVNETDTSLLEAAEDRGCAWPYSCRGGACANCAVAVVEGELSMPVNHVLPEEMVDRGIRLSCVGEPTTEELKVVHNLKEMPDLEELLLPPRGRARGDD